MKLLNRIIFITTKKRINRIKQKMGFTGAIGASSIIGKPNTMAGKF
jgi:hypothetical protein